MAHWQPAALSAIYHWAAALQRKLTRQLDHPHCFEEPVEAWKWMEALGVVT